jgi:hypothetical protein
VDCGVDDVRSSGDVPAPGSQRFRWSLPPPTSVISSAQKRSWAERALMLDGQVAFVPDAAETTRLLPLAVASNDTLVIIDIDLRPLPRSPHGGPAPPTATSRWRGPARESH